MTDWIKLRDGTQVQERWVCRCSHCEAHPDGPDFAEERHSFGIYAGRMCDHAWKRSGFIDAGPEAFDPDYAGESLEPEAYYQSQLWED